MEKDARLPDVCVKCGAVDGLRRRLQRFQHVPRWALLFFAPTALVAYQGTVFSMLATLGPLLGMLFVFATMRRAELEVALCATCKRRWTFAVVAMTLASMVPLVGLLALIASMLRSLQDASAAPLLTGVSVIGLSLLVPIVVYFTYVGRRVLGARLIDSTNITLSRVDPNAAERIVRGAAAR